MQLRVYLAVVVMAFFNLGVNAAAETKFKTASQYEQCRKKFLKTTKAETAGVASRLLRKQCGEKPLGKEDCDYLYDVLSTQCIDSCSEIDGKIYILLSAATEREINSLSIEHEKFNKICEKTCVAKQIPERQEVESFCKPEQE